METIGIQFDADLDRRLEVALGKMFAGGRKTTIRVHYALEHYLAMLSDQPASVNVGPPSSGVSLARGVADAGSTESLPPAGASDATADGASVCPSRVAPPTSRPELTGATHLDTPQSTP